LRLHGLQLTIADWLSEVHDTHHPIASSLYYEDQKREAKRRSRIFLAERLPKFLRCFERATPKEFSYVHLSLFQMIEGLHYAFPRAMKKQRYPALRRCLPGLGTAHPVQPARHLPPLPGARPMKLVNAVRGHKC
jgi:hypothetical protein